MSESRESFGFDTRARKFYDNVLVPDAYVRHSGDFAPATYGDIACDIKYTFQESGVVAEALASVQRGEHRIIDQRYKQIVVSASTLEKAREQVKLEVLEHWK